jgi:hypothetical protein
MSIYRLDERAAPLGDSDFDIDRTDPSLNGKNAHSFANEYRFNPADFNRLFFSKYGIDYISNYFMSKQLDFRVVTHPYETDTCFQKASLLNSWDPLNVIKALYFEYSGDHLLHAAVVPETGCFIDRTRLKDVLNLQGNGFLKKSESLPGHMSFGTCSPFIVASDLCANGGTVHKIIFDTETLYIKKQDKSLDDFSFGLDHRMSVQMNYYHCYNMLKKMFPLAVEKKELLNLSFKEKFVRNNGKIHVAYEFNSLNYRTAKFINSIHGYGNVSILNDYIDELDLPSVLTEMKSHSTSE